ncbi:GNAT family N-acetyltransferase [Shewanella youngdeokensis]|uniref:GNAT family N-acetyltransferase n=1 Tax=Shewanella youngdeokensis TaxID=2999068 RepID=A0ABZ0JUR9_9GAMM|nr:GNAT family N-acetyltransferase [Shewanella sp. DAU334]
MLELYTDRLRLRTIVSSDWDDFLYMSSSKELNQYIRVPQAVSVIRQKFELALTPNSLKEDQRLTLVIESVHSARFVGLASVHNVSETLGQLEVGYMLHNNAQGKGYATEALRALIDWASICHRPHKFIAHCADLNIASTKVLEKCGFLQEGLLRHNWKVGATWLDERFYGLMGPTSV